MQRLNLPAGNFRVKSTDNGSGLRIFDPLRKRFYVLTPEEWVRQHVVYFLLSRKRTPASLTAIEKQIQVNDTYKRYDIVVYRSDGSIWLLVECKRPEVKICQATFDQIARYNLSLDATYLMVSNGMEHYFCQMDHENERYVFLRDLPNYK